MIWNLLGAFVGYAAIDYIFVHFTLATVSNRVFLSGITASALVGLQGIVILMYVNNPWSIAAACVGAYVGTVAALKIENRRIAEKEDTLG